MGRKFLPAIILSASTEPAHAVKCRTHNDTRARGNVQKGA